MIARSADRIGTSRYRNAAARIQDQTDENIQHYRHADRRAVERRLAVLDREWDIDRVVEAEAPATILLGLGLGALAGRKWVFLSAFASVMVLLHGTQRIYPLRPALRRMGIRTQAEIALERDALLDRLDELDHQNA
ncbi:MAG TPA: hypothetical protein P5572_01825 [Phycisphaerae bacterium]|nr:hypothetical protein [Phycisphaerales bacterium]HRX83739.1 hypothetical protein [Phycisphaerae bacterium]